MYIEFNKPIPTTAAVISFLFRQHQTGRRLELKMYLQQQDSVLRIKQIICIKSIYKNKFDVVKQV